MSLPTAACMDGAPWRLVEQRVVDIVVDACTRIDDSPMGLVPADVHALRVSCKRLRALWRMLEPAFGTELTRPMERTLRDAAKQLAGQRQAWVLVKTLERLGRKASARKDRFLAVDLAADLAAALGTAEAPTTSVPFLRQAFEQQPPALRALPRRPSVDDLIAGIVSGAERARRHGRRARRRDEVERWHRCRRWVKYELYQLDITLDLKGALRRRHRRLERLGELLGRHQDGFDLELQLAGAEVAVPLPGPAAAVLAAWRGERDAQRLLKCIRRRQQRLLQRIEKRFDVLYGGRRGGLEAALRKAFART
ncbi:MAG: CHAD domain-containing protein [Gammaproteobacteria bacterium]|nr:CHAD domain-containing protein [Gammaproteobacteria bacterium]